MSSNVGLLNISCAILVSGPIKRHPCNRGYAIADVQQVARSTDCAMYVREAQRRHERHGELADSMIDLSRPPVSRAAS
jgi:hypothetical protein